MKVFNYKTSKNCITDTFNFDFYFYSESFWHLHFAISISIFCYNTYINLSDLILKYLWRLVHLFHLVYLSADRFIHSYWSSAQVQLEPIAAYSAKKQDKSHLIVKIGGFTQGSSFPMVKTGSTSQPHLWKACEKFSVKKPWAFYCTKMCEKSKSTTFSYYEK